MLVIEDSFHHPSADQIISQRELEESVNKYGSLCTLLTNKPISCITFFIILMENPILREYLIEDSAVTWYELADYLAGRYPVLNKSKKIRHEKLSKL